MTVADTGGEAAPPGTERIIAAIKERADDHALRFGLHISAVLAPSAAGVVGDAGEVNLLGEVEGEPSYFDVFEMEDELGARVGARVRIVIARALRADMRNLVERGMTPVS